MQCFQIPNIALPITSDLSHPIRAIGLRHSGPSLAVVTVPKAPMYEYDLPARPEDQIWIAWKARAVEPVSVSHSMGEPPNFHFRLGVSALDSTHNLAATIGHYNV